MSVVSQALVAGGVRTARLRSWPDYLIVGGKRCGTTSLQTWLASHPDVVPPHSGKGTHFFDENYDKGVEWFRAHYPLNLTLRTLTRVRRQSVITGEASPYYSFHPAAFQRIAETLPDVRLIFVLRDPVERAWSHWRYERRRGFEPLDIHQALDAEAGRLEGETARLLSDSSYVSWAHRHFAYAARGLYADQLERCLALFEPEQVLVVEFSELFGPEGSADRVCRFLGIPDVSRPLPRQESGGSSNAAPADVRSRLEPVFVSSNRRVAQRHAIDLN